MGQSKQEEAAMNEVLDKLFINYPQLVEIKKDIVLAYEEIINCYSNGGKLLLCGNGGSAADCEHIVGELLKGFTLKRTLPEELRKKFMAAGGEENFIDNLQGSLPAISLTSHVALSTAFLNDVNPHFVFAQQLYGLGNKGDVLIAMSTSGNAKNVINAVIVAKVKGIKVIALTGQDGGSVAKMCDVAIRVSALETYRIQEYHLPIYHALCEMVEKYFFSSTYSYENLLKCEI
jgi:D-sedoheptulose 7-phosphate isomerase